MALNLAELKQRVAVVTITWGDDTLDVGYFPASMTPEAISAISAGAEKLKGAEGTEAMDASVAMFADMLGTMVAWWDVLDADGQRMPVNAETVAQLPMPFTMTVLDRVQGELMPEGSRG